MNKTVLTLIERNDVQGTEKYLNQINWTAIEDDSFYSNWDDYNILKDLLWKGQTDMAKLCIKKGFRINRTPEYFSDTTPLHISVLLEYPTIVEELLTNGASTTQKDINFETALTLAAKNGNNHIIDLILSKIQIDHSSNHENYSHLHIACIRNNVDLVKKFLQFGIDINDTIHEHSLLWPGFTSLHLAVQFRSTETVKYLIDCGADITIKNQMGLTPLHLAFRNCNIKIVDIILAAHCYYLDNPVDPSGLTHFHIACARNNLNLVRSFVQMKGKVDHFISDKKSIYYDEYNALKFAIEFNCPEVTEFLLKYNIIPINRVDLDSLISSSCKLGKKEIINMIMNYRDYSKRNHKLRDDNISSKIPLHYALYKQNIIDLVPFAKSHWTDIIMKDERGETPIHLAYRKNQKDLVNIMLSAPLEIECNPEDNNGLTHFHICCTTKIIETLKSFITNGVSLDSAVDIDSPIRPGFTPLHFAVEAGLEEIINLLLDEGADAAKPNKSGLTPFDLATIIHGENSCSTRGVLYLRIMKLLLQWNNNNKSRSFNTRGISLLHIACAMTNLERVSNLINPETVNSIVDSNAMIWKGYTPLHCVSYYDDNPAHRSLITILLDNGADPSIKDLSGDLPAHLIDWSLWPQLFDDRLLLHEKNITNWEGLTTFHIACRDGKINVVEHYLEKGIVDVNEPLSINAKEFIGGMTALHFSDFSEWSFELTDLLLEYGANVNATSNCLRTPLHYCKTVEFFKKLIDQGANLEALDFELNSPIMNIIMGDETVYFDCHNTDIMKVFLENGTNVNHRNKDGKTPFTIIMCNPNQSHFSEVIIMMKHIKKMTILKLYVNEENIKYYSDCLNILERKGHFHEGQFIEDCQDELEEMKNEKIDRYTTLYGFLLQNPVKNIRYRNNINLKKIIHLIESEKKYPLFGYFILLKFKESLPIESLIVDCCKSLGISSKLWMSDDIVEIILSYLTVDDMKSLIESTIRIGNSKNAQYQPLVNEKKTHEKFSYI